LFFARSTEEELNHKRIHNTYNASFQVVDKMQKNAISIIKKSGIPYEVINEKNQIGNSFGEKLSYAVNESFQLSENVIIIGYDCPRLHVNDLKKAALALENGTNVIGKDHNGGVYILGINKHSWSKDAFSSLDWQTNKIALQIEHSYFQFDDLTFLKTKSDVNTSDDLVKLSFLSYLSSIISIILHFIHNITPFTKLEVSKNYVCQPNQALRGPPSLL
jgi:glycosyltransferase A (GT-A) superfamily protein (DUF2064 family)